ncbi:MerR family transcriptional regulator [Geobacter sp. AOG2]|uniref:MerR family transcriptional regulator n=1 Tax=Geobacter sp. AOG2 TaxID=1566347 RepID=UPI001CC7607B|nr:MerR family transcriptional regulator [Geobacter sp. AOG2]GFE60160.1 MerR family transcriptional regulator [Geobacter sp. AOG2]
MYTISKLARNFGLSRSTLLYYDRIGLLSPAERSRSGYRLYSPAERGRLETICSFRRAGLGIEDIRLILATAEEGPDAVLRRRLLEVGDAIRDLQAQQRLLAGMLKIKLEGGPNAAVDKATWVEMLRQAGMDEAGMRRWHGEFERRSPEGHHNFLLSLGVSEQETVQIRTWSRAERT